MGVHVFVYVLDSKQFRQCATCKQFTVTHKIKTVLEQPTWNREGRQLVIQKCHCCSYREEIMEVLNRRGFGNYDGSGGDGGGCGGDGGDGGDGGGGGD